MALRSSLGSKSGILFVSFNQDGRCIALGTQQGIKIYSRQSRSICYEHLPGAIGLVEMLFCSSIVAFVGAGEQPALTPRRLTVLNTSSQRTIQDIHFTTSVVAMHMNRQRLVVVLESKTFVYNVSNLSLLRTLDLPPGSGKTASALSACDEPSLLALPAAVGSGALRVYDLLFDGGNVVTEVPAHHAPLEALAWSHDAGMLASASSKGTVIRVHCMPKAIKAFTLRRGTRPATIHSLAFSPAGVDPPLLAASSSHGSVHLFRLQHEETRNRAATAASVAAGLLSSVVKVNVADMVDPQRPIASVRLPCQPVPSTCTILVPEPAQQEGGGGEAGANGSSGRSSSGRLGGAPGGSGRGTDSVILAVATLDGLLYEYRISELEASGVGVAGAAGGSAAAPKSLLEGEWALQGSMSLG